MWGGRRHPGRRILQNANRPLARGREMEEEQHFSVGNRWSLVIVQFEQDGEGDIICGRDYSRCSVNGAAKGVEERGDGPPRQRWPSWVSIMQSLTRKERKYCPSTAGVMAPSTLVRDALIKGRGRGSDALPRVFVEWLDLDHVVDRENEPF